MSKCFESVMDVKAAPVARNDVEVTRQYAENWDSEFTTPERYANYKITILRNDMHINITWDEMQHMRECTTRGMIDAAFRALIEKYWG